MKSMKKLTFVLIQIILLLLIVNFSNSKLNEKSLFKKMRKLDSSDIDEPLDTDDSSNEIVTDITSTPSTEQGNQTTNNDGNSTIINVKKSSSGLSTGAICAIVIPCVAAVLGAAVAAALCRGGTATAPKIPVTPMPTIPEPNYIDTSLDKFNVVQQPQVQPQIIQPEPQAVEVFQPPQPIIPSYPVTQPPEPPVVNNAFKPMYPYPIKQVGDKMHMVPVKHVEMVPVKKVEMVPVQEVVPIQQIGTVQQAVPMNQVAQIQQAVPIQNLAQIHQGVESIPQITQVSDVPGVTQIMPEVHNVGTGVMNQSQQIFQSGVE